MKTFGKVYLCGPITGSTVGIATNWRQEAKKLLGPEIICIDPTRVIPDYIRQAEQTQDDTSRLRNLLHGKEVLTRDRMDVKRCDIVLAYFLEAKSISIGSVGEIFWADAYRKPVIMVREKSGNLHDHGMLNGIAFCIYEDLSAAVEKIRQMLILSN